MNREQLAHVLRSVARIVEDPDILVVGSQAILGTYDDKRLPDEATRSIEVDVAFWHDPDEVKADEVDGSIGELLPVHEEFGYYGQGVSVATAVLPEGWRDRVVPFVRADAEPSTAVCLEAHDLVISKLVAGREKTCPSPRRWFRNVSSTWALCSSEPKPSIGQRASGSACEATSAAARRDLARTSGATPIAGCQRCEAPVPPGSRPR